MYLVTPYNFSHEYCNKLLADNGYYIVSLCDDSKKPLRNVTGTELWKEVLKHKIFITLVDEFYSEKKEGKSSNRDKMERFAQYCTNGKFSQKVSLPEKHVLLIITGLLKISVLSPSENGGTTIPSKSTEVSLNGVEKHLAKEVTASPQNNPPSTNNTSVDSNFLYKETTTYLTEAYENSSKKSQFWKKVLICALLSLFPTIALFWIIASWFDLNTLWLFSIPILFISILYFIGQFYIHEEKNGDYYTNSRINTVLGLYKTQMALEQINIYAIDSEKSKILQSHLQMLKNLESTPPERKVEKTKLNIFKTSIENGGNSPSQ